MKLKVKSRFRVFWQSTLATVFSRRKMQRNLYAKKPFNAKITANNPVFVKVKIIKNSTADHFSIFSSTQFLLIKHVKRNNSAFKVTTKQLIPLLYSQKKTKTKTKKTTTRKKRQQFHQN